jgi:sugar-specific transcriptional regulator TrmB
MSKINKTSPNSTIVLALKELGLGQNEAVLYEILLSSPKATIPVLRKKSPFSRTMLYYVLDNLANYELVATEKKGKKTVYNAEPSEKLEVFMKNQEKELKRQKGLLEDVIGSLKSSYQLALHRPGVRFFEGKEEIKKALYDSHNATETIYSYVDVDAVQTYFDTVNKEYVKKRESLQKNKKLLILDTRTARNYLKNQDAKYTEARLLPKNIQPLHTTLQIYNGKVLYLTARKDNLIGVMIEDKDIYKFHRQLFEAWWEQAEKLEDTTSQTVDSDTTSGSNRSNT